MACHGLFTVSALDKLYHNPSNITAKGSFHATGSLFQFPTSSNGGKKQNDIKLPVVNVMVSTMTLTTGSLIEMSVPQLSKESVTKVTKLTETC